uniref:Uncharacterized protein n=2 Tax=Ciona intestinalis TaxID=7719 RepID=H2XY77_CIOIN
MIPTAAASGCGRYGSSGNTRTSERQSTAGRNNVERGYGTERPNRKRRPLPPRPARPAYATARRDVGVMTPDFEDYRLVTDDDSPLNFAPISYTSTILTTKGAVKYDSKGSPKTCPKVGRKCRFCLILIPTFVAIATTAILIMFLL